MTSALVTGGAGFIGSHVVDALIARCVRVRVLDNLSTGSVANLPGTPTDFDLIRGDIRDPEACAAACDGVDTVFHLAAFISVPGSVADPSLADSVNIGGTLQLLLAARQAGVRRLVFSSSAAVYGDTAVVPTPETTLPTPTSPYGIEKLYGEHTARVFHQLFGLETVSLRYFNVYGPRQNPQSEYAAVVCKFADALLRDLPVSIYGNGLQTRDFLYVGDVARANLLAAEASGAPGRTFNLAGGHPITIADLYSAIAGVFGSRREPTYGPPRAGDILHSAADIGQARSVLGFDPQVDLPTGLRLTIEARRAFLEAESAPTEPQ